jgi:hypothetical protein
MDIRIMEWRVHNTALLCWEEEEMEEEEINL